MKVSILIKTIVVIVALGAIAFTFYKYGRGVLVSREKVSGGAINLTATSEKLPFLGKAPAIVGIESWINTEPLTEDDLKGKVVLVDFWTYSCINCIRTLPNLAIWHEKYKDNGFILLGVHSPEFDFEKKKENVLAAIQKHGVKYPVALDNDHATWNAFNNRYWPAHYLVDVEGNIRYKLFGEGHYSETESAIQQLLLEANLLTINKISEIKEAPLGVDFGQIGTPEIYLGYLRINNLGNVGGGVYPNRPHTFAEPKTIEENRFYFVGTWNIGPEFAESVGGKSKIIILYKANKANMVLGAKDGTKITIETKLDGVPMTNDNKGADVYIQDGKSLADVESSRLYNLSNTNNDYGWHTLELLIPQEGLQAFTFTFG